jgi:putative phosphoserine phosphatase/1-acylglycerol-3-phosphate O-acyltransferase
MKAPPKIAAFFDFDGTLLAPPSLEWRFIGYLLERDEITTVNVARWAAHTGRSFLSRGDSAVRANKHYLTGIRESVVEEWEKTIATGSLPLLVGGIECMHWHLERQHRVVLVTGTLAPLVRAIARHLPCGVQVRGTELEIVDGCFTGRIAGTHLSFEQKARLIRQEASKCALDLSQSFAYGNEMSDARMLEAVGRPATVNASWSLKRKARNCGWTICSWTESCETGRGTNTALTPKAAR